MLEDYQKTIMISGKDINVPLSIYSEGTIKFRFSVKSITKHDDESMMNEGEETHYTLVCDIIGIDVEKPNLEQAGERALRSPTPVLVKNNVNPAP